MTKIGQNKKLAVQADLFCKVQSVMLLLLRVQR